MSQFTREERKVDSGSPFGKYLRRYWHPICNVMSLVTILKLRGW